MFVWLIVSEIFELTAALVRSTVLRDGPSLRVTASLRQPLGGRLLTSIRRWQWVAFRLSLCRGAGCYHSTQRAKVLRWAPIANSFSTARSCCRAGVRRDTIVRLTKMGRTNSRAARHLEDFAHVSVLWRESMLHELEVEKKA